MRPSILFPLFAPLRSLAGVGPRLEARLAHLCGTHVIDICHHLPTGFIDRSLVSKVKDLVPGARATIKLLVGPHTPSRARRAPYRIACHDETGFLSLVFFHAHEDYLRRTLPEGETRYVSAVPEIFNDRIQITHPERVFTEAEWVETPPVEPVYPLMAGVNARPFARALKGALVRVPALSEWIDDALMKRAGWMPFKDSLEIAHAPQKAVDLTPFTPARMRLAYDELLASQLALGLVRRRMRARPGRSFATSTHMRAATLKALPFRLTSAQTRTQAEIDADMAAPSRMLRLLQGDVGAGKTIIAFLAMQNAIEAGAQAAFMVPTEILARQHAKTLAPLCEALGIRLGLLTGQEPQSAQKEMRARIKDGSCALVIGTHSLFQKDVAFRDLGICVIDEQHRFGVHQRLRLSSKSTKGVDVLVMTATPIPRTLSLVVYGDMDVSLLDERPPGRKPILTRAIPVQRLADVIAAVRRAVERGARVYWVSPFLDAETEGADAPDAQTSAVARHAYLGESFPNLGIGLVHGRMKPQDKNATLSAFQNGTVQILVATTVVEVGIDVPEATLIVIEHAERFGLAQLHQLRGRVGRGDASSLCLLLYHPPLTENAQKRLHAIRATQDGFRLAEEDMALRGAGELLGTRQSGEPVFRLADLAHHGDLLAQARAQAAYTLAQDPNLTGEKGRALRTLLYLFRHEESVRYLRAG